MTRADQISEVLSQMKRLSNDLEFLKKSVSGVQYRMNTHTHSVSDLTQEVFIDELSTAIRTITATTTISPEDSTILVNANGAAVTCNLPTAFSMTGRILVFKKIDSSANAMTLDASGSELIDGAATKATTTQYGTYMIQSDGSAWYII